MRAFEATNKYFQNAADQLELSESLRTYLRMPRREVQFTAERRAALSATWRRVTSS